MRNSVFLWFHSRTHRDEGGFTIVEAMVASFILAVGAFAVAQSLGYGLTLTGISRQKTAAENIVQDQIEAARTRGFDVVGLRTPTGASASAGCTASLAAPDILKQLPISKFFEAMTVRLDPVKTADVHLIVAFRITDTSRGYALEVRRGVAQLRPRRGAPARARCSRPLPERAHRVRRTDGRHLSRIG
jgi:type II secretory pathway pseudopilin PulG